MLSLTERPPPQCGHRDSGSGSEHTCGTAAVSLARPQQGSGLRDPCLAAPSVPRVPFSAAPCRKRWTPVPLGIVGCPPSQVRSTSAIGPLGHTSRSRHSDYSPTGGPGQAPPEVLHGIDNSGVPQDLLRRGSEQTQVRDSTATRTNTSTHTTPSGRRATEGVRSERNPPCCWVPHQVAPEAHHCHPVPRTLR